MAGSKRIRNPNKIKIKDTNWVLNELNKKLRKERKKFLSPKK